MKRRSILMLTSCLLTVCTQSLLAQENNVRSTGFPKFPKIVNNIIPGAPVLSDPILITGTEREIRTEKHGLAYPAFYDWNGDGKLDLLLGEFETGQTGSNIKVYLNEGTKNKPRFSGKYFYAHTATNDTISNYQWCCIGIHPRLIDINGDGKLDILSGQYHPGQISLWPGLANGFGDREFVPQEGYKEDAKLEITGVDKDNPRSYYYWTYSSADFADFDGDGLLDLFVGGVDELRVALNVGTKDKPVFGLRKALLGIDGYPLSVVKSFDVNGNRTVSPQYKSYSGVTKSFIKPVDWDGDGVLDLLVTHSYTDKAETKDPIIFFRGVNTDKGLRFEDAVPLFTAENVKKTFPGCQPNITITDFNNDGVPDLVFGLSLPTINGYDIDPKLSWEYLHDLQIESPGKDAGRAIEFEKEGLEGLRKKVESDTMMRKVYLGKLNDLKYLTTRHRGYTYVMYGKRPSHKAVQRENIKAEDEVKTSQKSRAKSEETGPVSFDARVPGEVPLYGASLLEVVVSMENGWHAYVENDVNEKLGFIPLQILLELPPEIEAVGSMEVPKSELNGGYEVFQGQNLSFSQRFKIKDPKSLKSKAINDQPLKLGVKVIYQVCNDQLCLPPVEEKVYLDLNILTK